MSKLIILAGVSLLATLLAGCVTDDEYYSEHAWDHREHARFHREFDELHDEAHAQGFRNEQEHRDWHRAYDATHDRYHEDHPGTDYP